MRSILTRKLSLPFIDLRRMWTVLAAGALMLAVAAPDAAAQNQSRSPQTFNVLPITITSVTLANAGPTQLNFVVSGLVGTTRFEVPLVATAQPSAPGAPCPVLDLALGPINLTLLGLDVDTSAICLKVTAMRNGGLLGDLLCQVANLLNGGNGLQVGTFGPQQIADLQNGLTQLLNKALEPVTSTLAVTDASCNILNLSLGPLRLNLLGLVVELDDCADGPVTVDITATPGGGLLGDLLCDLGNLLDAPGNRNQRAILNLLREIVRLIGEIVA